MTVIIIKAVFKVVPTTNNLAVVLGLAIPTSAVYNFAPLLQVINTLLTFDCVLCIYHLVRFKKDQANIQALLDSGSEINTISLAYAAKLGFKDRLTNVDAQKIDGSILKMFEIVLVSFQVENKLCKVRFFQETFLLANTSIDMILGSINN